MPHLGARLVEKLAFLPAGPGVFRTHEYTLSNLKSALAVEPDNLQLVHYNQRREGPRAHPNGFK
jgi:hydroxyacylglutathione hydrolase